MVSEPGPHPRLDWHLDNWARWHRVRDDLAELQCKTESLWSGNYDNDRETMAADSNQAEQVEAIINSAQCDAVPDGFTEVERCALCYRHLGVAVFRSNRESIDQVYERAKERLSRWLLRKGVP